MTSSKLMLAFLAGLICTSVVSAKDINRFWEMTRGKMTVEPMEIKVEEVKEPLPFKKYKVVLRGVYTVSFVSFLAIPIQGEAAPGPWPVIITVPGYGGSQQGVMLSECQRGYAVLQVYPRGQGESEALWKIDGDKLTGHLDRPEYHYYRDAYADVMRAMDFVQTRADLDGERIALVGTSQGGGIALAVGAVDPRVSAIVAHVPFLCNMRMASHIEGSLVKTQLDRAKRNDDAALDILDYFDPYQLAPQLKAPVLMSAGGKDRVCPKATIESVYERIPGTNKTLKFYPELAHTSCVDFYNLTWHWLDEHLRKESK
jgi:cephalosporin-C deacetylase